MGWRSEWCKWLVSRLPSGSLSTWREGGGVTRR
jgi:hypothetical protein